MSKITDKIFQLFWANTKRMDDKRIATLNWPEGVTEVNGLAYTDSGHPHHLLDVYFPENSEGKLPVIVDVHGGGWMYGDKELNKNYCLWLAKRGYVVFNMSYRLYPEITAIEQLRDVAKALCFIKEKLSDFPADENNICLTGDSAGGMLALFTSVLSESEKAREIFDVADHGIHFNAVGLTSAMAFMDDGTLTSVYTRTTLGKNYKKEKWAPYVNADTLLTLGDMIPAFMVTSSGDFLARKQVLATAELFSKRGIEHKLMDFEKTDGEDLPHVFPVIYPEKKASVEAIEEMLDFFAAHSKKTV